MAFSHLPTAGTGAEGSCDDPDTEEKNAPPDLPIHAYGVITHKAPDYSVRPDCSVIRRVSSVPSGTLDCKFGDKKVCVTIDSGATSNMVKADFIRYLGVPVVKSSQLACQADRKTPLTVTLKSLLIAPPPINRGAENSRFSNWVENAWVY